MRKSAMDRWASIATSNVKPNQAAPDVEAVRKAKEPEIVALSPELIEHRRRASAIELDLRIARSYNLKHEHAAKNNHSFDLTLEDWKVLMTTERCQYSGKIFSNKPGSPYARTMERINPRLGYTQENTIAVINAANAEKSQLDAFVKGDVILDEVKVKLLRKALYQVEKRVKMKG